MAKEDKKDEAQSQEAEKPAAEESKPAEPAEESRAAVAAKEAAEAARAASKDALKAVKLVVSDPVGKLPEAYESLGENHAMAAGIVFGVVFDLCVVIGGFLAIRNNPAVRVLFRGQLDASGVGLGDVIKLIIIGAIPLVSLALGGLVARKFFKGEGVFRKDLFVSGAALLPMSAFLLVTGIFIKVPLIIVAAMPFAISFSVLMLYAACTEMSRISKRAASLAVPVMLLVAGALTYIGWEIL